MPTIPIGDPRPAGQPGPAGDQRPAGDDGPAGDPRPAGGSAPNLSDTKDAWVTYADSVGDLDAHTSTKAELVDRHS